MYYGFRSGHHPFVTPPRYRGTTNAGVVGESIMEVDDIVGKFIEKLEDLKIRNDTLIILMSDNGPVDFTWIKTRYNHTQTQFDIDNKVVVLRGGKNKIFEAGHRSG